MEIRLLRAHAGLCGFAVAARAAPTGGCGRLHLIGSDCRSGVSRDRATCGGDANARGRRWRDRQRIAQRPRCRSWRFGCCVRTPVYAVSRSRLAPLLQGAAGGYVWSGPTVGAARAATAQLTATTQTHAGDAARNRQRISQRPVQIVQIRLLRAYAGSRGFAVAAHAAPTGGCGRLRLIGSDCRSGVSRDRATCGYDANARSRRWRDRQRISQPPAQIVKIRLLHPCAGSCGFAVAACAAPTGATASDRSD